MPKNKLIIQAKKYLPEEIERPLEKGFERTGGFFDEFRKFAIKGNVIDLAVGIIIGSSFTTIVNSIVNDLVMPAISLITGTIDFSNYYINLTNVQYETLEEAESAGAAIIKYGNFLNNVITFTVVAFVVFLMVKWINSLKHQEATKPIEQKPLVKKCPFCLEEVDINATRCRFCTSEIPLNKEKATEKVYAVEAKPAPRGNV